MGKALKEIPQNASLKDLITVAEAARLRGVTRSAIWDLIDRGKLRALRRFGLALLDRGEVLNYKPARSGRPRKAGNEAPDRDHQTIDKAPTAPKSGMLRTKEFAQQVGAPYPTVMGWLREGRIPGAIFDTSSPRGGAWWIPKSAVSKFTDPATRPHRGRRRKTPTKS